MEFLVDEIEPTPNGFVLHGIVNNGSVRVGSLFMTVRRMLLGGDRSLPEPIDIHVRRIVAYRSVLDELPLGMGAVCWLTNLPWISTKGTCCSDRIRQTMARSRSGQRTCHA